MQSESVLFSIITPIRNGLDYIDTYLESLLKQNYQNWEAIIIDDNSNDGGIEIIKQKVILDKRFRFYKVNKKKIIKGPYLARNIGLNESKGNFVCFLDIDDYWLPNKLSNQVKIINSHLEVELIFSNYYRYSEKNKSYYLRKPLVFKNIKTTIKFINPVPMLDACVKKDTIGDVKFQPINHEDYLFWQEIIKKVNEKNIYINQSISSIYRINNTSISSSKISTTFWILRIYKINNNLVFCIAFKIFIRFILQILIKVREKKVILKTNYFENKQKKH